MAAVAVPIASAVSVPIASAVAVSIPIAAAVAVGIVAAAVAAPVARAVAEAEAEARVAVVARAPAVPRSAHRPAPIVPRPAAVARRGGGRRGGGSGGKQPDEAERGKQAFPNHADTLSALPGPRECGREYWFRQWREWPEPGLIATFMQGSAWRSSELRA